MEPEEQDEKAKARSEAARLMGSVMTPAKYAAVLKAAQTAGRKKGTPQSEETKAKIRAARLAQESAKREAMGDAAQPAEKRKPGRPRTTPEPDPSTPKRPVGRPRKQAEETNGNA